MGAWPARWLTSVAGAVSTLMLAACGLGDIADETRDTLEPLEQPTDDTSSPQRATSRSAPAATPDDTENAPTTERQFPTGDWNGDERFDVGRIVQLTTVGHHDAINFDRYTYRHPRQGLLDAPSLTREPIVSWYRRPPFINQSQELRTLILDPDVTVLVLERDSRPQRCGQGRGNPSWREVDTAHLLKPVALQRIASLTYSDDGLVTRIRFTRGC